VVRYIWGKKQGDEQMGVGTKKNLLTGWWADCGGGKKRTNSTFGQPTFSKGEEKPYIGSGRKSIKNFEYGKTPMGSTSGRYVKPRSC